jgi:DNA-directed RNA polymerase specialized sigma24 family protein
VAHDAAQAWRALPAETRELVESVLTKKQLDAVILANAGYGKRTIARSLNVDVKTAKDRLSAAERKITRALEERGRAS